MKYINYLNSTVPQEINKIINFLESDENRTSLEKKENKDLFVFDINGDSTGFKINQIKTFEEYQKKGVCTEAMKKIISVADEHNMSISLFPYKELDNFYENLGFKFFHGRFHYGPLVKQYENECENKDEDLKKIEMNKNIFIHFIEVIKKIFLSTRA